MHTLGFGSSRTGAGLGRIRDIFGGRAEIQGLEPGSSPTSGTATPSQEGVFALTRRLGVGRGRGRSSIPGHVD